MKEVIIELVFFIFFVELLRLTIGGQVQFYLLKQTLKLFLHLPLVAANSSSCKNPRYQSN
jgi:hypothetical protein